MAKRKIRALVKRDIEERSWVHLRGYKSIAGMNHNSCQLVVIVVNVSIFMLITMTKLGKFLG